MGVGQMSPGGLSSAGQSRGARRDRPSRWQQLSLRTRIAAFIAVVVCTVTLILGGLIGQSSLIQLRGTIGASVAMAAARIAERLNAEMSARSRELRLLATLDPLGRNAAPAAPATPAASDAANAAATQATADQPATAAAAQHAAADRAARVKTLLDDLVRTTRSYQSIAITDVEGHVLATSDGDAADGTMSAGTPALELSSPIQSADGTVLGKVVGRIRWNWAREVANGTLMASGERDDRREAFLVNGRGRIVIGPPGSVGQTLSVPVIARTGAGFVDSVVEAWPDGQEYLTGTAVAASDAPGSGAPNRWTVLVRERLEDAYAPAYALRNKILALGITLAATFALMGWIVAGWVTAPLKEIAVAAERLRQGDDVELPRIGGPPEIHSLSRSLRALVATLTRNQVALDEMQELALRDPLTGLLNRNGLRLHLQNAMLSARAEGSGLLVNDKLGHAAGDQLLMLVARRLSAAMRSGDAVARLGGDEFVLALRAPDGVSDAAARALAERVLLAISAPYDLAGSVAHVGGSLGGAAWPEQAEARNDAAGRYPSDPMKLDGVFEKADAALYMVKRSGKGRVLMHGEALSVA
jgi:diguanylate cyclase (GGDEF)-like protein